MPKKWSITEVEAAVEDYFDMLRLELLGEGFSKSEHRRNLLKRLDGRTDGSVEIKHQNISAVLIELGIPYIDGYKPLSHYQYLLKDTVSNYLEKNPGFREILKWNAEELVLDFKIYPPLEKEAPPHMETLHVRELPSSMQRKTDYLELEAQNQKLGEAGEKRIIEYERAKLIRAGKESLADRIEWVSETRGPAAGYDVLSYDENGKDRFIEVKTTKYGKCTPFFVTKNELEFSREYSSQYCLYRLFRFRFHSNPESIPGMFALQGFLQDQCSLEPSLYRARV